MGVEHCSTLVQGVDFERFTDQPWNDELKGFRVFSGGKYEFRKGQDIVIAAMEQFMSVRDDAFLVTSWSNPWPETAKTMENSWLIDPSDPTANLPKDRVINLPWSPNAAMPARPSKPLPDASRSTTVSA